MFKAGQIVRLALSGNPCGPLGVVTATTKLNLCPGEEESSVNAMYQVWYSVLTIDDEGAMNDPEFRVALLRRLQENIAWGSTEYSGNVPKIATVIPRGATVRLAPPNIVFVPGGDMVPACNCCLKAGASINLQFCSNCRVAAYCGRGCQRQDWKHHQRHDCFIMGHMRAKSMMPLYQATDEGNIDKVRRLLKDGANVNRSRASGKTALLLASFKGCMAIVECLVQHRADINLNDATGNSPLAIALEHGHLPIAEWLVQNREQTADMERANKFGFTLLLKFISNDHLPAVRFLVEHGANLRVRTNAGSTALLFAALQGSLNVVKYLVEKGLSVNDSANVATGDLKPLYIAVDNPSTDVVRYLLHCGASVDAGSAEGRTALKRALRLDNLPIVQYLVEARADINKPCERGSTSVHYAARFSSLPTVQYLVNHKADLKKCDEAGESPLVIASRNDTSLEVAAYIRSQLE